MSREYAAAVVQRACCHFEEREISLAVRSSRRPHRPGTGSSGIVILENPPRHGQFTRILSVECRVSCSRGRSRVPRREGRHHARALERGPRRRQSLPALGRDRGNRPDRTDAGIDRNDLSASSTTAPPIVNDRLLFRLLQHNRDGLEVLLTGKQNQKAAVPTIGELLDEVGGPWIDDERVGSIRVRSGRSAA